MTLLAGAWSRLARMGNVRGAFEDYEERRLRWVRDHARGHSFADIGGLFKYMGDISFLAEESGATSVTLLDVGDPDLPSYAHPEWGSFAEKHQARDSKVRYVQGDLEDPVTVSRVGRHDVVFYSGVLYHTPNPVQQLMRLRDITGELAFISTLTIPEIPGFPNACVFYPHLAAKDRAPYAAGYHWADDLLAIGTDFDERPMHGHGNCWWGMSVSALVAMLATARFEVVEQHRLRTAPFQTELVVRPVPIAPSLPPLSYFRERGEARERGEPRWRIDDYYDSIGSGSDG